MFDDWLTPRPPLTVASAQEIVGAVGGELIASTIIPLAAMIKAEPDTVPDTLAALCAAVWLDGLVCAQEAPEWVAGLLAAAFAEEPSLHQQHRERVAQLIARHPLTVIQ